MLIPDSAEAEKRGDVHKLSQIKDAFKNERMSKVTKDEQGNLSTTNQNLKTDAETTSADVLSRLSDKIGHMSSYINDLESKNKELKVHNIDLLHQVKNTSLTDNQNVKSNDPNNERDICEDSNAVPQLDVDDEFQNLQLKLNEMNVEIDKLQKANDELKETIQILQRPVDLKKLSSKSKSQLFNESDPNRKSESIDIKELANVNEKLKLENENLAAEINKLKNSENLAQMNVLEMEKDLEKFTAINGKLFAEKHAQDLDGIPPDLQELISKYGDLKKTKDLEKSSRVMDNVGPLVESDLGEKKLGKVKSELPNHEEKTDVELLPRGKDLLDEIEKLQSENNKLRKANDELKETIQIIQQPKKSSSEAKSQFSEKQRGKLSSKSEELEIDLEKIESKKKITSEKENLLIEEEELKDPENLTNMATLEMEKDLMILKAINEKLLVEISSQKSEKELEKFLQGLNGMPTDTKDLISENEELRNANKLLLLKIKDLEGVGKSSYDLKRKDELENLSEKMIKISELQKTISATKSISREEISKIPNEEDLTKFDLLPNKELIIELRKLQSENCKLQMALEDSISKNLLSRTQRGQISTKSEQVNTDCISIDIKQIENENERIKLDNEKLVVEIGELKTSENQARVNNLEMEKELARLSSLNQKLLEELNSKMPPDLKDLLLKNEELRNENEQLLMKANYLENFDERALSSTRGSELCEDILGQIISKFPSNEDLIAEIGKLQHSKQISNTTMRQMENDLKKLKSRNERLLVQLNDKDIEIKKCATTPDVQTIHQQNEDLKLLNENLLAQINELKNTENVAVEMKNDLENLTAVNKTLLQEINELKKMTTKNSKLEPYLLATDKKKLQGRNEKTKSVSASIQPENEELKTPENRSHSSILQMGRDLEKLAALNESLLAFTESDMDRIPSSLAPDINKLFNKNQELKKVNENLSAKIKELQNSENRAHSDANESQNKLETLAAKNEKLLARIKELEQFSSIDINRLKNENENVKSMNESLQAQIRLLEQKLQNINNRTEAYLKTSTSSDSKHLATEKTLLAPRSNDYNMEIDWMVSDMKKLQNKNENLKAANEKLLSQISDLQCANRSNLRDSEIRNESENMLTVKESDNQLVFASNRNIEIEWMKTDMEALKNKNVKLKTANESLAAEIGVLKSAEARAHKNTQQMERDLLKLSAINERLTAQLNDKKQLSKARIHDGETNDPKDLLKKIDELTSTNERLVLEITELKCMDAVKMRNDIKKLSSTNESLKLQISELQLMSANDLKMESNWMATDIKKLLSKNKKLNISNQNLLNENTELRREFKSMENRANMNALQKLKELERLTAINENLTAQLNYQKNEKKNAKSQEYGLDAVGPDIKKVQRKNDELKAANEKLLSVILNLKNTEKLATARATELEKELTKLQDTNKSLQDTLENYVEKDWNKPKVSANCFNRFTLLFPPFSVCFNFDILGY